jgi:hypothetical protein
MGERYNAPICYLFCRGIFKKGKGAVNVQQQMQKQEMTEGTCTALKIHFQWFG